MRITTYQEAKKYLESHIRMDVLTRFEADKHLVDPLERMRYLLNLLGNPHRKYPSIQVTGTSGKGSTAYLISHILTKGGYKTGFTLSPHLQRVHERLQINGREISNNDFLDVLNAVIPAIERMTREPIGKPSYFEILLAMAFLYFAKQKVDIIVAEVGLEGRYDATNALHPIVVVLTNISLDHTAILGDTVEKIASEVVYAIKEPVIVVTGRLQPSVRILVDKKCRAVGAKKVEYGKDFTAKVNEKTFEQTRFSFTNSYNSLTDLEIPLKGAYQVDNASLAVETVLSLRDKGFVVSNQQIRQALKTAFFPGRFEVFTYQGKTVVLDGAHNDAKMQAFLQALNEYFPHRKKYFVVGFKRDKNISGMMAQIISVADRLTVTSFQKTTDQSKNYSMSPPEVVEKIHNKKQCQNITTITDSKKAFQESLSQLHKKDVLIVTGSLYLIGEIRDVLTGQNQ